MAASTLLALLGAPFRKYNSFLEQSPFATKCVTSGVMYATGDIFAQAGEHYNSELEKRKAAPEAPATPFRVDWSRAAVFGVYGTIIAGPLYSVWFGRLDQLPAAMYRLRQHRQRSEILRSYTVLRRYGVDVQLDTAKLPVARPFHRYTEKAMKIAADQLIFSSLYAVVFFMSIGMMRGGVEKFRQEEKKHSMETTAEVLRNKLREKKGAGGAAAGKRSDVEKKLTRDLLRIRSLLEQSDVEDESIDRVLALLTEEERKTHVDEWGDIFRATWDHTKEVYWQTYVADCIVWPPLQFINFTFVPLRYQVRQWRVAMGSSRETIEEARGGEETGCSLAEQLCGGRVGGRPSRWRPRAAPFLALTFHPSPFHPSPSTLTNTGPVRESLQPRVEHLPLLHGQHEALRGKEGARGGETGGWGEVEAGNRCVHVGSLGSFVGRVTRSNTNPPPLPARIIAALRGVEHSMCVWLRRSGPEVSLGRR
jgi:hypothetical protein